MRNEHLIFPLYHSLDWLIQVTGHSVTPFTKPIPETLINLKNFGKPAYLRKKHCVKSGRIRSYSGPNFPVFSANVGQYGPE